MQARKPTKEELAAATTKTIDDLIDHDLKVLFCGINPGLYSGATGLHFARPGNRFWKSLHLSGFTERQLDPSEGSELLRNGIGITCIVARTTARADELSNEEFIEGGKILTEKLTRYRPQVLAILGIGAYRCAFARPRATVGRQQEKIADSAVWLLPNPSGLNASYQLDDITRMFAELRSALK